MSIDYTEFDNRSVLGALRAIYTSIYQVSVNTSGGSSAPTANVQDVAVETALGTTTDASWSGTGATSAIAALKAIFSKLNSTLATAILPPTRIGQGNTTIPSNVSTAINASINTTPNSGAFPTGALPGPITIKNSSLSANPVYVCWQGGTCSSAVGELLAVGEGMTENLGSQNMTTQPPTVYTAGATLTVKW